MPLKKSERHASLWKSCDELRGDMDASQYRDYVLALLFVQYVSDKAECYPDPLPEVPYGGSFRDMVQTKNASQTIHDPTCRFGSLLLKAAAIVTVLSGMDAEITAPESRRDKTHVLRQGMMQELLTRRIRSPMARHRSVSNRTTPTVKMRQ